MPNPNNTSSQVEIKSPSFSRTPSDNSSKDDTDDESSKDFSSASAPNSPFVTALPSISPALSPARKLKKRASIDGVNKPKKKFTIVDQYDAQRKMEWLQKVLEKETSEAPFPIFIERGRLQENYLFTASSSQQDNTPEPLNNNFQDTPEYHSVQISEQPLRENYIDEIEHCNRIIERYPHDFSAHSSRTKAAFLMDDMERALAYAIAALALPNLADYKKLDLNFYYDRALKAVLANADQFILRTTELNLSSTEMVPLLFKRASLRKLDNNIEGAFLDFNSILTLEPNNTQVQQELTLYRNNLLEVIKSFARNTDSRTALQLAKHNITLLLRCDHTYSEYPLYYLSLMEINHFSLEFRERIENADRLTNILSDQKWHTFGWYKYVMCEAYRAKAHALTELNEDQAAIAQLDRLMEFAPEQVTASDYKLRAELKQSQKDLFGARKDALNALAKNSSNELTKLSLISMHRIIANAAILLGEYLEVLEATRHMVELDPASTQTMKWQAYVKAYNGNFAEAVEYIIKSVELRSIPDTDETLPDSTTTFPIKVGTIFPRTTKGVTIQVIPLVFTLPSSRSKSEVLIFPVNLAELEYVIENVAVNTANARTIENILSELRNYSARASKADAQAHMILREMLQTRCTLPTIGEVTLVTAIFMLGNTEQKRHLANFINQNLAYSEQVLALSNPMTKTFQILDPYTQTFFQGSLPMLMACDPSLTSILLKWMMNKPKTALNSVLPKGPLSKDALIARFLLTEDSQGLTLLVHIMRNAKKTDDVVFLLQWLFEEGQQIISPVITIFLLTRLIPQIGNLTLLMLHPCPLFSLKNLLFHFLQPYTIKFLGKNHETLLFPLLLARNHKNQMTFPLYVLLYGNVEVQNKFFLFLNNEHIKQAFRLHPEKIQELLDCINPITGDSSEIIMEKLAGDPFGVNHLRGVIAQWRDEILAPKTVSESNTPPEPFGSPNFRKF